MFDNLTASRPTQPPQPRPTTTTSSQPPTLSVEHYPQQQQQQQQHHQNQQADIYAILSSDDPVHVDDENIDTEALVMNLFDTPFPDNKHPSSSNNQTFSTSTSIANNSTKQFSFNQGIFFTEFFFPSYILMLFFFFFFFFFVMYCR
jgi:hypothetical protein